MQILFSFTPTNAPLNLPLSYHHILQGLVYNMLGEDPLFSDFLHNAGYEDSESHKYKLFVFSDLMGKYKTQGDRIIFPHKILFELRSPSEDLRQVLLDVVTHKQIFYLANQKIELTDVRFSDHLILTESVRIQMISPITLHLGYQDENGVSKTRYISPKDEDFGYYLNKNFGHKYEAAFGRLPEEPIQIAPESWSNYRKYVTQFNNKTLITAWNGYCTLKGRPDYLNFVYDTGLGDRNSQGFGMFAIDHSYKC